MDKKNNINLIEIKEKLKEKIGKNNIHNSEDIDEELNNSYKPKSIHKPNQSFFSHLKNKTNANIQMKKSPSAKSKLVSVLKKKMDVILHGKMNKGRELKPSPNSCTKKYVSSKVFNTDSSMKTSLIKRYSTKTNISGINKTNKYTFTNHLKDIGDNELINNKNKTTINKKIKEKEYEHKKVKETINMELSKINKNVIKNNKISYRNISPVWKKSEISFTNNSNKSLHKTSSEIAKNNFFGLVHQFKSPNRNTTKITNKPNKPNFPPKHITKKNDKSKNNDVSDNDDIIYNTDEGSDNNQENDYTSKYKERIISLKNKKYSKKNTYCRSLDNININSIDIKEYSDNIRKRNSKKNSKEIIPLDKLLNINSGSNTSLNKNIKKFSFKPRKSKLINENEHSIYINSKFFIECNENNFNILGNSKKGEVKKEQEIFSTFNFKNGSFAIPISQNPNEIQNTDNFENIQRPSLNDNTESPKDTLFAKENIETVENETEFILNLGNKIEIEENQKNNNSAEKDKNELLKNIDNEANKKKKEKTDDKVNDNIFDNDSDNKLDDLEEKSNNNSDNNLSVNKNDYNSENSDDSITEIVIRKNQKKDKEKK